MLGLLQILEIKQPEYASINETVNACKDLKVLWAKKLVNGVLRNILRNIDNIIEEYQLHKQTEAPKWILSNLKSQYPDNYLNILKGINTKADMFIRLNVSKETNLVIEYLDDNNISYEFTNVDNCIRLHKAIDVKNNTLFQQGYFTVQDMSAQYAGLIINPNSIDVILDACAAPGGKTTHILELNSKAKVTAIDIIDKRLDLLTSNIERVSLDRDVKIIKHDLTKPLNGKFNKIVLDAPCSALGTIKRNPDIKMSRKPIDIDNINILQQRILQNLWDNNLKRGGQLLYITCSILEQENQQQISKFLEKNK
jgi:16S rRNA (cytosine967-C5)-methyltransferase